MFDKIIGFIGAGNMGSAMIGGILNASLVTTGQVIASAHSKETLDAIHSRFSIETTLSNETVAERSDILFLAVKPNKFDEVIPQIAPHVKSNRSSSPSPLARPLPPSKKRLAKRSSSFAPCQTHLPSSARR